MAGKIEGARPKPSGGVAWYKLLSSAAGAGTETGSWVPLGYLGSSTLADETGEDKETDEDNLVYLTEGERTVSYEQKIRQRDKFHIDLATKTVAQGGIRGEYFRYLKEESNATINGKYQYTLGAICKVSPSLSWSRPGNEVTFKVIMTENASAVTLTDLPTGMRSGAAASNFTVPAKGFWSFIEVAS